MDKEQIRRFRKQLLGWYRQHRRDLPWRQTKDPYRIWVSEVMLQQTRVETVVAYYLRFVKQFPDLSALVRADLQDVLPIIDVFGRVEGLDAHACSARIRFDRSR